jgi:hypothetical protein
MVETILGLLRHGQTDWNVEGRLQGTSDIALNETGLAQAQAAAEAPGYAAPPLRPPRRPPACPKGLRWGSRSGDRVLGQGFRV